MRLRARRHVLSAAAKRTHHPKGLTRSSRSVILPLLRPYRSRPKKPASALPSRPGTYRPCMPTIKASAETMGGARRAAFRAEQRDRPIGEDCRWNGGGGGDGKPSALMDRCRRWALVR